MAKKQKKKVHYSRTHNDAEYPNSYKAVRCQAAQDIAIQFAPDCACIVLHEAFGFGEKRLRRFHDLQNKSMQEWWEATSASEEAGYYREKLDEKLKDAGVLEAPFEERYEWIKFRI